MAVVAVVVVVVVVENNGIVDVVKDEYQLLVIDDDVDYEVSKLDDGEIFERIEQEELMNDLLNCYDDDDVDDDDDEIQEDLLVDVNNLMDYYLLNDRNNVNQDLIFHERISKNKQVKAFTAIFIHFT